MNDVPGVRLVLREEEIKLAESLPGRDAECLASLAGLRYWMGGSSAAILWRMYAPNTYGPMVYSNVMFKVEVVKTPEGLQETKLRVMGVERKKGRLWYLVALSPIHKDKDGGRFCSAIIQGYYFDDKGDNKHDLVLSQMELTRPAPIYWLEVTDAGKRVDWPEAVQKARETNRRAAYEDTARDNARVGGQATK